MDPRLQASFFRREEAAKAKPKASCNPKPKPKQSRKRKSENIVAADTATTPDTGAVVVVVDSDDEPNEVAQPITHSLNRSNTVSSLLGSQNSSQPSAPVHRPDRGRQNQGQVVTSHVRFIFFRTTLEGLRISQCLSFGRNHHDNFFKWFHC